jgi:hypothetical protein
MMSLIYLLPIWIIQLYIFQCFWSFCPCRHAPDAFVVSKPKWRLRAACQMDDATNSRKFEEARLYPE